MYLAFKGITCKKLYRINVDYVHFHKHEISVGINSYVFLFFLCCDNAVLVLLLGLDTKSLDKD